MVRIAIAAATSELAREVLDKLVAAQKHEIIALTRGDTSNLPAMPGVSWIQTTYEKQDLVGLLQGVNTVLCFIVAHLDPEAKTMKTIVDAAVEAGVKRYASSDWTGGMKLDALVNVMPLHANKTIVAKYLEDLNKDKKVIEYCRFAPGVFVNYLGHPHKVSKHISTVPMVLNFEKAEGTLLESMLDSEISATTVDDIASVVTRAVDYEGEWPVNGSFTGDRVTWRELIRIGEKLRGKLFDIDWLKKEDLEAGIVKTDKVPPFALPSVPEDQQEGIAKAILASVLLSMYEGGWTTGDVWNQLLPDFKFTKAQEFLEKVWA